MKFVDEVLIDVIAGDGGTGCSSFRREAHVPLGGPDGGDGGNGGSVYLQATSDMNTLVDYRHDRIHRAKRGDNGAGKNRTGRSGEDLVVPVPLGTLVYDNSTDELIGDLVRVGQKLLVAKGGSYGLGNARFKTSTNRAPRQIIPGTPGDRRRIRMELKILADVGLLGLPNAGKSTLIRSLSSAKPKVADYPFTTLHPNLGVVSVDVARSFVIADIPGLIPGAAEGAGLGIQFLKHIARTRVLLHLVDLAPFDESDPAEAAQSILKELEAFDTDLLNKPRWLVFNKVDLLDEEEMQKRAKAVIDSLQWTGDVYTISALEGRNTRALVFAIMDALEQSEQSEC